MFLASCKTEDGTHTVRYLITGPQTIARFVLYTNETGNLDQISNVPIPWEKTITVQGLHGVSCHASFDYGNSQTYTAKVFVDGFEVATASSSTGSVSASGVTQ